MSTDFVESANGFFELCKGPSSRLSILMQDVLDHCDIAFEVLDFNEYNTVLHENDDVRFSSTLSSGDLVNTCRVINFDDTIQASDCFTHIEFCFRCRLLSKIGLRIGLEVEGLQPSVVA